MGGWKNFICALAFLFTQNSHASPILIGHNLTPTSYVLPEGEFTLGTYAVAYGVTERWTLATSPWLIINYNMPVITSKLLLFGLEGPQSLTLETSYFKTFPYLMNMYEQESFFVRLIATQRFTSYYALHFCGGIQYFINQHIPYSLHINKHQTGHMTTSFSMLNELFFTQQLGFFLEAGVLGLNYPEPYSHLGASVFLRFQTWMIQAGISVSSIIGEPNPFTYHGQRQLIHPEMQLQFTL